MKPYEPKRTGRPPKIPLTNLKVGGRIAIKFTTANPAYERFQLKKRCTNLGYQIEFLKSESGNFYLKRLK